MGRGRNADGLLYGSETLVHPRREPDPDRVIAYDCWDDFVEPLANRGIEVEWVPAELRQQTVRTWPYGPFDQDEEGSDERWAREGGSWIDAEADRLADEGYGEDSPRCECGHLEVAHIPAGSSTRGAAARAISASAPGTCRKKSCACTLYQQGS